MILDAVEARLLKYSILTRALIITWSLIVRAFISPYDKSSIYDQLYLEVSSQVDLFLKQWFSQFANWDGVYFIEIARHGYRFEKFHAFFPLYPYLISKFSAIISIINHMATVSLNKTSLLLLSGLIITHLTYFISVIFLYKLTFLITKHQRFSFLSTLFYIFSPNGIFFSAIYTESIFAMVSLVGVYCQFLAINKATKDSFNSQRSLTSIYGNYVLGAVFLMLAACIRSNGILLVGFSLYAGLEIYFRGLSPLFLGLQPKKNLVSPVVHTIILFFFVLLVSSFIVAPYFLFELYGFRTYCTSPVASLQDLPAWCKTISKHWTPALYAHVQATYWDVGPLRYWQSKHLPHFLLALPIYIEAALLIRLALLDSNGPFTQFIKRYFWSVVGFQHLYSKKELQAMASISSSKGSAKSNQLSENNTATVLFSGLPVQGYSQVLPFVLHFIFLVVFSSVMMHVQVVTRLVSSSPAYYWTLATLWLMEDERNRSKSRPDSLSIDPSFIFNGKFWIIFHCYGFMLVGTLLFTIFLPWT
jgi:GPI mannosyltransferase 2